MEELFGIPMNWIMFVLLVIFISIMAVVVVMAWLNRIMLKLGLRNIPRRRGQSVIIVVGSMLSAVIIASAFGIGDTISFSIRDDAIKDLGTIDEVLVYTRDTENFGQGGPPYFPRARFDELALEFSDFDSIDGMLPYIAQTVPVLNTNTSLTEGQARVTAADPEYLDGFWPLVSVSGEQVLLQDLSDDGVYVNDKAAEELDAEVGHTLSLFLGDERVSVRVEGVVESNGIGGRDPTILMTLELAQRFFEAPGQINAIAISNRGGVKEGAELSEEVTEKLRVFFADHQVALQLKSLLNQDGVLDALADREESLGGNIKTDISELRSELLKEELSDALIRLLSDDAVSDQVLEALKRAEASDIARQADTLFRDLAEIEVFEIKRFLLDIADAAGSGVTSIFILFGLFSIVVGILLIFLIFVMLAAARRTDMGMARAVGAKRSHLVQMFVFEGTAYDLAASILGTTLGLLISLGIIALINSLIGNFDEEFRFAFHIEARSVVVAFCLGMIITFATAAVSAYRVSRMNIAEAVRGLPETLVLKGEYPFLSRLLLIPKAVFRPLHFQMLALPPGARPQILYGYLVFVWLIPAALIADIVMAISYNGYLALVWLIPPVWIADIGIAISYKLRGRQHPWWNSVTGALFRPFIFAWWAIRPYLSRALWLNMLLSVVWLAFWLPGLVVALLAVLLAGRRPWWKIMGSAAIRPLIFYWRALEALYGPLDPGRFILFNLLSGFWVILFPIWMIDSLIGVLRFTWPYMRRGWLLFLLGIYLVHVGVGHADKVAPLAIGASLMIMGTGLMLRLLVSRVPALLGVFPGLVLASGTVLLVHGGVRGEVLTILIGVVASAIGAAMLMPLVLNRSDRRPETINRLAFTFIGVIMLAYWMLPFDTMEPITGVLEGDFEMFFLSGISMVAAAVWTVMYNADLLLRGVSSLSSRIGKLRPVLVTAVAYPMSTKFRTGLTVGMFALIVFTMIVMSLITEAFSNTFNDPDRVLGEWDIGATVSFNNPISDIRAALGENPELSAADFEAIGGFLRAPVDVRQPGSDNLLWKRYILQASDDEYLDASRYDFRVIAEGYGDTKEEVWQALRLDPSLAVIDAAATQGADEGIGDAGSFKLEGVSINDKTMDPIEIEVMEPLSGGELRYTIIGVLDSAAADTGIITSKAGVDEAFPSFTIPLTDYRFRVAEGVDTDAVSKKLEAAFLEHGMQTEVLAEVLKDIVSTFTSFYNMLTGYMGLGIVVGIAALGVVSMRAVVERRQQIGVLRAIGYRRGMIQLSFLLESSFVALLGVALGVALGTIISINLVDDIEDELEGLRFSVPWLQIIVIIAATYVFSMLATYLPARQASRTTPAEALRYE